MRRHLESAGLWIVIVLGVALRMTDIAFPDISTDEAQFALGASAAQPPLGMALLRFAQETFGPSAVAARSVSVLLGIVTLGVIYGIARHLFDRKTALITLAVAAIFPSHILFSRLAYLSVPLSCAWLAIVWAYLKATSKQEPLWLFLLFVFSVAATLIKTQGLLLPATLLLGRAIERRGSVLRDPVIWILLLSLVPIALYIGTHPGIAATLLLYGGNMYGVSGFSSRIVILLTTWWPVLLLVLPAIVFSLATIRRLHWPVWILLLLGTTIGLILGPGHEYYTTHLVYWALPIGLLFARMATPARGLLLTLLVANTCAILAPHSLFVTSWTHPLYREEGYWNTHADRINAALGDVESVIALGPTGHHVRWYVTAQVLVGNEMDITPFRTRLFIVFDRNELTKIPQATILYEDETLVIARK
ncbi:MAG: glycosyltransferase family 39 protein [Candidatus Peribacteraceae bacterium]|nr:glycosyltransferase family 39 protein [Candidatus Peribacteraceae bacterium]